MLDLEKGVNNYSYKGTTEDAIINLKSAIYLDYINENSKYWNTFINGTTKEERAELCMKINQIPGSNTGVTGVVLNVLYEQTKLDAGRITQTEFNEKMKEARRSFS